MDSSEFLAALETLFELAPGSMTLSSVLEQTPGWGSLKFLCLIGMVDDRYGVILKPRQIHQCPTIADLFSLVSSKCKT